MVVRAADLITADDAVEDASDADCINDIANSERSRFSDTMVCKNL